MDTGHSWWNVLIRWFSLMMIVRKMIASHTNWNISAFLLFARNLALTRIMDWRRRWDIYCLYIVVLTLHCCRQRIPTLCTLSTSSHEECDWQIIANDSLIITMARCCTVSRISCEQLPGEWPESSGAWRRAGSQRRICIWTILAVFWKPSK